MILQNDFFNLLLVLPFIKLFHLSNLLQMLNDQTTVDVEFFISFSCSCKRISFGDCSQLVVVSFWWPATVLLVFKALISFVKLREPRLHCTFVNIPRPSELLMLWVISAALWPILNLNKKVAQMCFLSNIISIISNKEVVSQQQKRHKARNVR